MMKWFLIIILIVAAAVLAYGVLPTLYHKYWRRPRLAEKEILLTFDDGPDAFYTENLCQVLSEYGVHALFFVVASKAQRYPEVVQNLLAQGHQVGLHGLTHNNMWLIGQQRTKQELSSGLAILTGLGVQPCFYRPPYGNVNWFTLPVASGLGLHPLWWNVIVGDWHKVGGSVIAERLREQTKGGSIVCLHDSGEDTGGEKGAPAGTIEALQEWIPEMLAAGYRFSDPALLTSKEVA